MCLVWSPGWVVVPGVSLFLSSGRCLFEQRSN